ncbi:glycosyltransferase family 2 protein [Croceibacter atlanticus]|uniref:glycosyltransferase family 2 protein n=1 Tax=Croceibacter atlanticus TaxID=313588 RepID=UPI002E0E6E79|nr:glycosyltransferase family 2 protein [Croceibacter atlanticus]
MIKLSAVIITFNEALNIERCLKSLIPVIDEIVVVDSFSTDNTKEICLNYNVTFIEQEFLGYIQQKNFALTKTSSNYVVSLDGDEALSDTLQKSILKLKSNWQKDGYYIKRYNNFCGQWINHSGWYPDKKLRVFDKTKGSWQGINPHDSYKLSDNCSSGSLDGDILHWNYKTYSEFNLSTEKFSTISASSYFELGKKAPLWKIILKPTWAFFNAYIIRLGILDGFNGFVIAVQTANITFLKYIKLRELIKLKQ